jgi:hypothetical protein
MSTGQGAFGCVMIVLTVIGAICWLYQRHRQWWQTSEHPSFFQH